MVSRLADRTDMSVVNSKSVGFLFPGQGSQFPGMAADIVTSRCAGREVLDKADAILGYSLTGIMSGQQGEALNRTTNTQPAVFAHSMALLQVLRETVELTPAVAAGHSLGEYSALCAAGALDFEDALKLVATRATAMDAAQAPGVCAMVALIGLTKEEVLATVEACRCGDVLEPANFNAPDQVVVSGHVQAVLRLEEAVKAKKRTRAVRLPVSSAFHTSLMQSAQEVLSRELHFIEVKEALFPVMSNAVAVPHPSDRESVKQLLVDQVVKPVLWEECMRAMLNMGVRTFLEIGPGKVLTGLLKRIDRSATGLNVSTVEEAIAVQGSLG
jgi:[acyl-carrier-protein] S-malonyltransferase